MRRRIAVVLVVVVGIGALALWGAWRYSRASFRFGDLKRPWTHYAVDLPAVLSHCLVARGSDTAALKRAFGPPDEIYDTSSTDWERAVSGLRAAGWTVPSQDPSASRVMVYWLASDLQSAVAYHFVTKTGRLTSTFIGET